MGWLRGKKTFIIAILMVFAGLIRVVTGDETISQFFSSQDLATVLTGLGLGALRSGIGNVNQ